MKEFDDKLRQNAVQNDPFAVWALNASNQRAGVEWQEWAGRWLAHPVASSAVISSNDGSARPT